MNKLSSTTLEENNFFDCLDFIWKMDTKGCYTFAAGRTQELLGYTPEEIIGKTVYDFLSNHEANNLLSTFDQASKQHTDIPEYKHQKNSKLGKSLYFQTRAKALYDEQNKCIAYQGIDTDISQQKEVQVHLNSLNHIIDDSLNEIYIFDPKTLLFSYVNQAVINNLQYSQKEILELKAFDIKPDFTENLFKSTISKLEKGLENKLVFTTLHQRKDGTTYPVEVHLQLTTHEGIHQFVAIILDRTKQKIAEEKLLKQQNILQYQANHDVLTNLPNRFLFNDRLAQAISKAKRTKDIFALFFLDLDKFKFINDNFGHERGDTVLKTISNRLKDILREEDSVSRLGGDEFTILIENIKNSDDITHLAYKVLDSLKEPIEIEGEIHCITSSIGISLYPQDANDAQSLLKHADIAMYKSKQAGANTFAFYQPSFSKS